MSKHKPPESVVCVAVHSHGNGVAGYLFRCERGVGMDESAVAEQLGVDFEPDQGETFDIASLSGFKTPYGVPDLSAVLLPIVRPSARRIVEDKLYYCRNPRCDGNGLGYDDPGDCPQCGKPLNEEPAVP